MTYTEDDTFNALKRVPFLTAWNSIGFSEGAAEKYQLERLDKISDDVVVMPGDTWHDLFEGWTWQDYKQACRNLYDRKYK